MSEGEWRILHFSDLHFASDTQYLDDDKESTPPDFREDVIEYVKVELEKISNNKPDIIAITGDVTITHSEEGFRIFEDFTSKNLLQLLCSCNEERCNAKTCKEKLCIVPGNHDVQWGIRYNDFQEYNQNKFREFRKVIQSLSASTCLFPEFSKDKKDLNFIGEKPYYLNEEKKILVLNLNSSIRCGEINEKKRKKIFDLIQDGSDKNLKEIVNQMTTYDIAHVSKRQRRILSKFLKIERSRIDKEWNNYLKIALLHHHLLPFENQIPEYKAFELLVDNYLVIDELFKTFDFNLVLTGHKHHPYHLIHPTCNGKMLIVGGLTVGGQPASNQRNGFLDIKISRKINGFKYSVKEIGLNYKDRNDNEVREIFNGVLYNRGTTIPSKWVYYDNEVEKLIKEKMNRDEFFSNRTFRGKKIHRTKIDCDKIYKYEEFESLIELIKNEHRGMNICLVRGATGTGKTMFILRFMAYFCQSDDNKSIFFDYFNAYSLDTKDGFKIYNCREGFKQIIGNEIVETNQSLLVVVDGLDTICKTEATRGHGSTIAREIVVKEMEVIFRVLNRFCKKNDECNVLVCFTADGGDYDQTNERCNIRNINVADVADKMEQIVGKKKGSVIILDPIKNFRDNIPEEIYFQGSLINNYRKSLGLEHAVYLDTLCNDMMRTRKITSLDVIDEDCPQNKNGNRWSKTELLKEYYSKCKSKHILYDIAYEVSCFFKESRTFVDNQHNDNNSFIRHFLATEWTKEKIDLMKSSCEADSRHKKIIIGLLKKLRGSKYRMQIANTYALSNIVSLLSQMGRIRIKLNLSYCNLSRAYLNANLKKSIFKATNFYEADLSKSEITENTKFIACDLRKAKGIERGGLDLNEVFPHCDL